jgi:hypothetical protein
LELLKYPNFNTDSKEQNPLKKSVNKIGNKLLFQAISSQEERSQGPADKQTQSTELTTTPAEIACSVQIDQLQQKKLDQSIKLEQTNVKLEEVSKQCNVINGDNLDNTDEKIMYWMKKSDRYKDHLASCNNDVKALSGRIKGMEQSQKSKEDQDEVWQKAWAKHDHGICVKACDLMRNAACKMAFGLLSFRSCILD